METQKDNRTEERRNRFNGQSVMLTKQTVDSPYWGKRVETTIKKIDNNTNP